MLIGYARISTPDQCLDYQRDDLITAGCIHVFSDVMSGANSDRPGLKDAVKLVKRGDTLVVWSLDRLGRSLKDLIELIAALEKRGAHLITIHEKIDTQSIAGKLFFQVFGILAEFERTMLSERTKAGLTAARARGRKGGRPRRFTDKQEQHIAEAVANREVGMASLRRLYGTSDTTLRRIAAKYRCAPNTNPPIPLDADNPTASTNSHDASAVA